MKIWPGDGRSDVEEEYAAGESFTDREDVLEPRKPSGFRSRKGRCRRLKCGDAKILAFNYTFIAERGTEADTAKVSHPARIARSSLDVELKSPARPSS